MHPSRQLPSSAPSRRGSLLRLIAILSIGGVGCTSVAGDPVPEESAPLPTDWRAFQDPKHDSVQDVTLSQISAHEPIYFAVGFNEFTNAKFQFSFKYRFAQPPAEAAASEAGSSFLRDIYFGYTQTSVWDLESDSVPFFDSSYRPSLYWQPARIDSLSGDGVESRMELGLEHESNGKAGLESRSINMVYAKPRFDWSFSDDDHFVVEPKLWLYLEKSDNADIDKFRGYVNLRLEAFDDDGLGIAGDFRVGDEFDRGSMQIEMTYPLSKLIVTGLEGFLYVQYFNGWGETLRSYNFKTPSQVRIGFALVR